MRRHGAHQLDSRLLGALADQPQRRLDRLGHRHGFLVQLELAGFDLRQVQNVVYEAQQMVTAIMNVRGIFLVMAVADRTEHLVLHHLGKADDGVQGSAQLVADAGEEIRLGARGDLRLVLGGA